MEDPVHILLVEDFAGDTLLIQQVLASCPVAFKLHVARDGEQALQMLADPNLKLDLIILDLDLPRITGLGVLERSTIPRRSQSWFSPYRGDRLIESLHWHWVHPNTFGSRVIFRLHGRSVRDHYEMGRKEGKRRSRFLGDEHRFTSEPQDAAQHDYWDIPTGLRSLCGSDLACYRLKLLVRK
jgi:hypothetical protein